MPRRVGSIAKRFFVKSNLPAAVLLLGPLFVIIGQAIGIDSVQLGLMMVVNLSIGLYMPPVGSFDFRQKFLLSFDQDWSQVRPSDMH